MTTQTPNATTMPSMARWPENVPRNYTELFASYDKFIVAYVRKRNTVRMNHLDIVQEIRMRIIAAKVLEKFVLLVSDEAPETLTLGQAIRTLGVNVHQWRSATWRYNQKGCKSRKPNKGTWMPTPINVADFPEGQMSWSQPDKVVYRTADIQKRFDLDEAARSVGNRRGRFNVQHHLPEVPEVAVPVVPKQKFCAYLMTAIGNHFANFCRTSFRRHKERTSDCFVQFRANEEGEFDMNWAASIADESAMARMEAMAEVNKTFAKVDEAVLGTLTSDAAPIRQLWDLVGEGYSIVEAVKKLDIQPATRRQILRQLQA